MKTLDLRKPVLTWAGLMALLAITAGSSLLPLGVFNLVGNFAIAILKAALVLVFFMRLLRGGAVVHIAAATGLLWLGILVSLSLVDFLARGY